MGTNKEEYPSHQKFIKVKWPSGSEEVHYSMYCSDLPEDIIQNAMREVNETEETKTNGIRCLKEFMQKNGLTCSDDEVLIFVLRNCKYNIKKSEAKLKKFLKLQQMVGKKIAEIDMKIIADCLDELAAGLLPYRDEYGRIIVYTRPIDNIVNYETDVMLSFILVNLFFSLSLPMSSLLGVTYITDSDCSSMHVWYSLVKVYRKLITNLTNIPVRLKRIEIVNDNFFIRWFYNILWPILPRKIVDRISFLGEGYDNLLKQYHPDILPSEFGGSLGPLSDVYYRKKLLDFAQKMKAEYSQLNL